MILWRTNYNFCLECRTKHRLRSRQGHKDLPLCDRTNGESCEIIKSWMDSDGKIHREPIQLHANNHTAFLLYEIIASLGTLQEYQWNKNKKTYRGYYPDLSMMDFVFRNYLPEMDVTDVDLLIKKITIIHKRKLEAMFN